MKIALKTLTLVAALTAISRAEDESSRVDFHNDLIPLFTKHGCNAGACHGAAIGRGGFKLSLYGGDPAADYNAIVRHVGGRRVNLSKPDESLVVLKPAEVLEHGGGSVIDYDGESAQLLKDWIRQGATRKSNRHLSRIAIEPRKHVSKSTGEPIPLRTIAYYSDGSERDVTRWTIFTAEDSAAVEIQEASSRPTSARPTSSQPASSESAESNGQPVAKILRRGRHIVVARYLSEVVPIEMIVPLTESRVDLAAEARNNFVDENVYETLTEIGLEPSPAADDATFLRRIYLDLTGRLPSAERVRTFLAGDQANKRTAVVDELLGSAEFTEYWAFQFAKLLRIRPLQDDAEGALTYHRWLAEQLRTGVRYDRFAHDLIMASGDSHEIGPANFHRTVPGPREQAEFVSELFMGSRLRCANCHNHPLDRWTQDDYHGLAAIFAKIERGRIVRDKPTGRTMHPRTLEPAAQRIPGEQQALAADATDTRKQLADWLTQPSNPYFAKAIVNRLWKEMMGRGLVEPVDDFRDTNPATHPVLLNQLADDFVANGYRLRHTLKVIANSHAYARSAIATTQNKDDDRFYSHALRKPLQPEALADAISDVLGVPGAYGGQPEGTRAVALVNPTTSSRALDILGRCDRSESCESTAGAISGLSQKLHLLNGDLLNARLMAEGSRLKRLLDAGQDSTAIIDEFYVVALGRHPTIQEHEHWKRQVDSASNREAFLADFVWGLLVSNEFVTNH